MMIRIFLSLLLVAACAHISQASCGQRSKRWVNILQSKTFNIEAGPHSVKKRSTAEYCINSYGDHKGCEVKVSSPGSPESTYYANAGSSKTISLPDGKPMTISSPSSGGCSIDKGSEILTRANPSGYILDSIKTYPQTQINVPASSVSNYSPVSLSKQRSGTSYTVHSKGDQRGCTTEINTADSSNSILYVSAGTSKTIDLPDGRTMVITSPSSGGCSVNKGSEPLAQTSQIGTLENALKTSIQSGTSQVGTFESSLKTPSQTATEIKSSNPPELLVTGAPPKAFPKLWSAYSVQTSGDLKGCTTKINSTDAGSIHFINAGSSKTIDLPDGRTIFIKSPSTGGCTFGDGSEPLTQSNLSNVFKTTPQAGANASASTVYNSSPDSVNRQSAYEYTLKGQGDQNGCTTKITLANRPDETYFVQAGSTKTVYLPGGKNVTITSSSTGGCSINKGTQNQKLTSDSGALCASCA